MITISHKKAKDDQAFLDILPDKLYKYRNWGVPHGRDLIEKLSVFYAYTALFEDKNDCHPQIADPTINDLYNFSRRIHPEYNDIQHQNNVRQLWDSNNNADVKERIERGILFERQHDRYYGVLCLTSSPTNHRLWYDNSKDHNGYCVEFNPKELIKHIPIGSAGPVEYKDNIPCLPFGDFSPEMARLTYFVKTKKYAMEEEFRIIKHYNHVLTNTERNVIITPDCISRIFVDSRMTTSYTEEMYKVVKARWEIVPLQINVTEEGIIL